MLAAGVRQGVDRLVDLERQLAERDAVLIQKLLVQILGGREHEPVGSLRLGQRAGEVERECQVLDPLAVRLVNQVYVGATAPSDESGLAVDLPGIELLAGGREEHVARQRFIVR